MVTPQPVVTHHDYNRPVVHHIPTPVSDQFGSPANHVSDHLVSPYKQQPPVNPVQVKHNPLFGFLNNHQNHQIAASTPHPLGMCFMSSIRLRALKVSKIQICPHGKSKDSNLHIFKSLKKSNFPT